MECPEAVECGRNFRLLEEDELSPLLDFLTEYLPESLKFQQTLLTYMRDRVWDFHFYVANNWPEDAICLHFPGMTLSPHGLLYESVSVFCPNDRLELLRLLREEDILLHWWKPLYINFVHYDIAEELTKLYEGTGTIEKMIGDVCAYDRPEDFEDVEESEDEESEVQVRPLQAEHAEGIHELYPANDMECHEIFLRLIKTLPAAGVFVKGDLAAWMVQSYYGAMFSMQTRPEYRRKGYGTKLAKYLTKRVTERGYRPFVVIRPENEASHSLYRKLGFRKLYQTVRMIFMPFSWEGEAEGDSSNIQKHHLEDAVRQLNIEQRVISAMWTEDAIAGAIDEEGEETIRDPSDIIDDPTIVIEEPDEKKSGGDLADDLLEPISEQPEVIDMIDASEDLLEPISEQPEVTEMTKASDDFPEFPDETAETSEAVESQSIAGKSELVDETSNVLDQNGQAEGEQQAGDCE